MFYINYQIVKSNADDFWGQNGFFQLKINENTYGEIYSAEIADRLIPDEIIDWFDRLIDVLIELKKRSYVALSDTESYNSWIEFVKQDTNVIISLRILEKWNGANAIEYQLVNAAPGRWIDQKVPITDFEKEIINKANQYVHEVLSFSVDCLPIQLLKKKLAVLNL